MKLLLSFILLASSFFATAQEECVFFDNDSSAIINKAISTYSEVKSDEILTIPIVFHIINKGENIGTGTNISEAQIHSAVTALNEEYRNGAGVDMRIEFCLMNTDDEGNPSTGIYRYNASGDDLYMEWGVGAGAQYPSGVDEDVYKNWSRQDNQHAYNIWVVSEISGNNGGGGVQGYAYFPTTSYKDGTTILYNAVGTVGNLKYYTNLNKTLAHELGHAIGLYHTFQSTASCTEINCNLQGDRVCDTPPTTMNSNCSLPVCNQQVENIMDYTSQSCKDTFTQGQKTRGRSALQVSRANLLASNACSETVVEESICTASTVVSFKQGHQLNGQPVPENRSDATNALGTPEDDDTFNFVSLGISGELILSFGGKIYNGEGIDISVYETTFNDTPCDEFEELVEIYVSQDGTDWMYATTTCRDAEIDLSVDWVKYIKFVDITTGTADGWDLDGVIAHYCEEQPTNGVCYATSVISYTQGSNVAPARTNTQRALGEPQDSDEINFLALGIGGEVVLEINAINEEGADIVIVETTFNDTPCNEYEETADVFISNDGEAWIQVGTDVCRDVEIDIPFYLESAKYIKIVDTTPNNGTDGYDIDGVIALHGCITYNTIENELEGVYDVTGRYVGTNIESLPRGIYIIKTKTTTKKIIR